MSDVVISVESLSKRYLVGHNTAQTEHRPDFRELISRNVSSLARKTRDVFSGRPIVQGDDVEEFWALNDVSFEVKQGERLGIIGRNGAGKSTLLKILSRITEPTKGRIRITGRVASLLEVGTGFHPELSGRENIYLNGAILGMSRAEVHRKFDEIVAFADVERFLDTPVKRYSSGMYVRLAFAVAAHLEPEILIVDEVLAVGDAQFQKKCLDVMRQSSTQGRTVLFVSHNVNAIMRLCDRCILLRNGALISDGSCPDIVNQYNVQLGADVPSNHLRDTQSHLAIVHCSLRCDDDTNLNAAYSNESCTIEVSLHNPGPPVLTSLGIAVNQRNGERLFGALSSEHHHPFTIRSGDSTVCCNVNPLPLNHGVYSLTLALHLYPSGLIADKIEDFLLFDVVDRRKKSLPPTSGPVLVNVAWG